MVLSLRPLDVRAHAHAPGRPSPLRESFDADDLPEPEEVRITLKFKVPVSSGAPLAPNPSTSPTSPTSPTSSHDLNYYPSPSPDDDMAHWTPSSSPTAPGETRTSMRPSFSPPTQVFTYTPYSPAEDSVTAIAAAAAKNRGFVASLRAPLASRAAHEHLTARLRRFEARRAELQRTIADLEAQRRAYLASEAGGVGEATRLREWTDDDLAYDRHALAKLDGEIRRWERFVGEVARGEVCSRTRLRLREKRPREEAAEGKVARAKMDTSWSLRGYDVDAWCRR